MQVRRLSPCTERTYVETVARFARCFDRAPARLGPEEIRAYQIDEERSPKSARQIGALACRPPGILAFGARSPGWPGPDNVASGMAA